MCHLTFQRFPSEKKKIKKKKKQTPPGILVIKIQWDFGIAALYHRQVISRFAGFEPFAVLLTKLWLSPCRCRLIRDYAHNAIAANKLYVTTSRKLASNTEITGYLEDSRLTYQRDRHETIINNFFRFEKIEFFKCELFEKTWLLISVYAKCIYKYVYNFYIYFL